MKAFILTQADFEKLLLKIDRDPLHGADGGSSDSPVRDREKNQAYKDAHRFYNYQVRTWIDEVTK